MMSYIKSQAVSDEADAAIGESLLIALGVLAVIWIFSRLYEATERKSADVSNCIAGSSDLSGNNATDAGRGQCTDTNRNSGSGHYDYTASLSH